jgi:undecaprenyl-diphosphatase
MSNELIIFGAKYLLIVIIAIALLYFLKQPRSEQKRLIIFSVICLPLIYLTAKILSLFYYNPRPFVSGGLIPLVSHNPDNGFTSDHTLLAGAISAVIFYFNRKTGMFLLALALLVGIARVMAGVHHLIDIAGSISIAFIVSFCAYRFLLPMISRSKLFSVKNMPNKIIKRINLGN